MRGATTVFAVLFLPVVCAGTILPLALIGALPADVRRTGAAVGEIYATNTVGAIAGAFLGGFLFIPVFGTQNTLLGVSLAAAVMGCVFSLRRPRPLWLPIAAIAASAAVVVGVALRPDWNFAKLQSGVFEGSRYRPDPEQKMLYHREGPTASVIVTDHVDMRVLRINARTNASTDPGDLRTQILLAQIPLLFAPHAEEIFIVGWGSGITVGAAARSSAKRITAVELEPAVVEASRFFVQVNHDPINNPRVRLYEDDARHILLASRDTYDIIISESPSLPTPGSPA